jgi:hypothetical protein
VLPEPLQQNSKLLLFLASSLKEKCIQKGIKLTAQMRKREVLKEGKLFLVHPTEIEPKLEFL